MIEISMVELGLLHAQSNQLTGCYFHDQVGYVLLDLLMNLIIIPLAENRAGKFTFVRKPCTAREVSI